MRPPDENQPGSMRASFMSAPRRPASTEDNILARLERGGRRGGARAPWKRSWIAWCSVACLTIIGLLGLLASLARDNIAVHQPAVAAASTIAPEPYRAPVMVSEAPLSSPVSAAVTAQPTPPAAVVDARPALAMFTPAPAPVKAAAARPAASAPRKSAPLAAAKPPPARTVAASAARIKKTAPAPEPAVDSDVALLSAIILHSSRHAGERAQLEAARCGAGRKCLPAPAPEPLTWLKTLD